MNFILIILYIVKKKVDNKINLNIINIVINFVNHGCIPYGKKRNKKEIIWYR